MDITRSIQTLLRDAGYYSGKIDGLFYAKSRKAFVDWLASLPPEPTHGSTPPVTIPPASGKSGTDRTDWRGFVPVDEWKLRSVLPSQAQMLAPSFINHAKAYDLNPLFLVAISKHETDVWRSNVFVKRGNAMGISNSASAITVSSYDESIRVAARSIGRAGGYYSRCKTLADVGAVYAPVGAKNDPGSRNKYWPSRVAQFWHELEKAIAVV